MPLYEYECEQCSHRFEVIQRFSDAPIETCNSCGGPVHKLLSASAIQFKGSGWYVNDYGRKDTPGGGKPEQVSETTSSDTCSKTDSSSASSTASGTSSKQS
jgi:putative FmdB family regulatory protein